MGIRPHIEIVIGTVVEDGSQYKFKDVGWEQLESVELGELEDEKYQFFSPQEAKECVAYRMHLGNPAFNPKKYEHIIGFIHKYIDSNTSYLLIDLLTSKIDFQETDMASELYIDLPRMDEEEVARRKRRAHRIHNEWGDMWDLAEKENRLLPYEPYPQITDRWWESAVRALKFAGYDVPREQLKMYLVVYWC
jgi:hypothetical protein